MTVLGLTLLGAWLDFADVWHVLSKVFRTPGFSQHGACAVGTPRLVIDRRLKVSAVLVAEETIPLANLKSASKFDRRWAKRAAWAYVLAALPHNLVVLAIGELRPAPFHEAYRITAHVYGALLILRSWVGADVLLTTGLGLHWAFSRVHEERSACGDTLSQDRVPLTMAWVALAAFVPGTVALSSSALDPAVAVAALAFVVVIAAYYGALVSAVHGLALAPTCIFTALDEGLAVRYSTKTSCGGFVPLYRNPITRTFGTMASVERRIFFVPTDELKFMLMLQGRSGAV